MLTEIEVVEDTVKDLNFETFAQNQQALRVILYGLAVIGEAVAKTIDELETQDSNIPWRQIRGLRNMVIHEYFRVDLVLIWQTIQEDLPMLKESLLHIQNNLRDTK
ncbi:HepT-like ribonuclease domain-containing protein [Cyanobacterium aponinum AL20118]|nr:HepT-like ribonuclease domain-containing protein [Cyanobacterium aponinum]MTF37640.1 DUF86 domain-containing protein [Cyanobacterium aponinum 0216]WPF87487.1 HepT-like ribonuclease domain-containing protein [Cyanobacterium aponinum AL20115]